MSAALEVQKAIVAALKADAAFGALAGDAIYAEPPDSVSLPYVGIAGVDIIPALETNDSEGEEVAMTLHVWAGSDVRVMQIMAAMKAAIHDQSLALDTQTNVLGREFGATVRRGDGPAVQGVQRFRFLTHP